MLDVVRAPVLMVTLDHPAGRNKWASAVAKCFYAGIPVGDRPGEVASTSLAKVEEVDAERLGSDYEADTRYPGPHGTCTETDSDEDRFTYSLSLPLLSK